MVGFIELAVLAVQDKGTRTLWSSHQSTLGLPVSPAALRTCVGFTCARQRAPLSCLHHISIRLAALERSKITA